MGGAKLGEEQKWGKGVRIRVEMREKYMTIAISPWDSRNWKGLRPKQQRTEKNQTRSGFAHSRVLNDIFSVFFFYDALNFYGKGLA